MSILEIRYKECNIHSRKYPNFILSYKAIGTQNKSQEVQRMVLLFKYLCL